MKSESQSQARSAPRQLSIHEFSCCGEFCTPCTYLLTPKLIYLIYSLADHLKVPPSQSLRSLHCIFISAVCISCTVMVAPKLLHLISMFVLLYFCISAFLYICIMGCIEYTRTVLHFLHCYGCAETAPKVICVLELTASAH